MNVKTFLLFCLLGWGSIVALHAQQRLSQLDLSRASQTYGTPVVGKSVTGEEAFVDGEKCEDPVGVYTESIIRVNVKGYGTKLSGKIGVADSKIDYDAPEVTSLPQPDGTRVFYRKVGERKYLAGVEDKDRVMNKGSVLFRVLGDGKELFAQKMTAGEKMKPLDVDIRKVKRLELRVENGGDGYSGDFAVWSGVRIDYDSFQASSISTEAVDEGEAVSEENWKKMSAKLKKLPVADYPAMKRSATDWLLASDNYKAEVRAGKDGKSIVISNGLTARIFRIVPNLATVDIVNQMSGENMLRAVSGEGELVINGEKWYLGGLEGQPERGYLKLEWLEEMTAKDRSFVVEDFEVTDSIRTLDWARSRWALNKKLPTGKSLTFVLRGVDEVKNLKVKLHYDIYDHIPVIRKHMEIFNEGKEKVNLDSFKLEQLFFAEPESTDGDMSKRYLPNIHVESDYTMGGTFWEYATDKTEHWTTDKEYTSQCNYGLNTLCTLEVYNEVGPDVEVTPDKPFSSYQVYEMPVDSYDRERKGLFLRRFYRTVAPWTTENPIFMHLTTIDEQTVKRAVDQCVETGYEMIILSFGSGMDAETTDEKHIAYIKSLVDYAKSKGIEMGGYSLLASRWISDEVDVINPATGKRGGAFFGSAPCLCSQWGVDYLAKIKSFYEKTGLTLLEHDGSYPGDVCASTVHPYHKGLQDSQWKQFERITDLYHWCLSKGISLNVPDFYFLNGSTKVGIGYREVNWSLPRDRQLIHSRQVNYSHTFDRMASSCWSFVPLVEYHGGGAAATLEPLSEHLETYYQIMMANYGAGVQACYRGPRLYDTDETKACVQKVISWYKRYREILNSDMIHLRRPDGRDWDGFVHVNPTLKEKALAMFFNPTSEVIERTVKIPLYYTGLTDKARIRVEDGKVKTYRLNRDYTVEITVRIPANGHTWLVVE